MTKLNHWYSNPTQVFWTCKALTEGRIITHKTEIREVKGWRLAAITERLRRQYKWPILVDYRGLENTAHYYLRPGTDLTALNYPPSAASLAKREIEA